MEIELKEKRTLITGGSGGIGSALTTAFAKAGAEVCFTWGDSARYRVDAAPGRPKISIL